MIPLWIKLAYTIFAAVIVTVYLRKYKPQNFLWFSDIALLVTAAALWLESGLLAGMMAVGVLLPEIFWNVGFFTRLLTGRRLSGLTDYMFEAKRPMYLKALSLYHIVLPVLLIWLVSRLGYVPTALPTQIILAWIILPLSYLISDTEENVNWVFGPGGKPPKDIPPLAYLGLVMIGFPVLIYLPTHLILDKLF